MKLLECRFKIYQIIQNRKFSSLFQQMGAKQVEAIGRGFCLFSVQVPVHLMGGHISSTKEIVCCSRNLSFSHINI